MGWAVRHVRVGAAAASVPGHLFDTDMSRGGKRAGKR
jgi:hypothetical protein